ncbi:hypothetical protein FOL47_010187 [Perkinsus chesapeaki]|uniref:EF-hand domain-containing protein n=1 Tax=Perkinsus chesapeaki TaxID=330153 RepID=A0A7J6MQN3_PERCH|nr:hypothetical protein FOL47_010187 [Perkinsus chesapeaki]
MAGMTSVDVGQLAVSVPEFDVFKSKSQAELCEMYTHFIRRRCVKGPLLTQEATAQLIGLSVGDARKLACSLHHRGNFTSSELGKAVNLGVDMYQLLAVGCLWSRGLTVEAKLRFIAGMFDFDRDGLIGYDELVLLVANFLRAFTTVSSRIIIEGGEASPYQAAADEGGGNVIGHHEQAKMIADIVYLSFDDLPKTACLSVDEVVRWALEDGAVSRSMAALPSLRPNAAAAGSPKGGLKESAADRVALDDPTYSVELSAGFGRVCPIHSHRSECRYLNEYEVVVASNVLALMKTHADRTYDGSYRQVLLSEFRRLYERARSMLIDDGTVEVEKAAMTVLHRELCNKVSYFKSWFMSLKGGALGIGVVSFRTLLKSLCPCAGDDLVDEWIIKYLGELESVLVSPTAEKNLMGRLFELTSVRKQQNFLRHYGTDLGLLTLREAIRRGLADAAAVDRAISLGIFESMDSPLSKKMFLKHVCHPKFRRIAELQWDRTLREMVASDGDGGTTNVAESILCDDDRSERNRGIDGSTGWMKSLVDVDEIPSGRKSLTRVAVSEMITESLTATIDDVAERFRKKRVRASEEGSTGDVPTQRELTEELLKAIGNARENFVARGADAGRVATASDSSVSPHNVVGTRELESENGSVRDTGSSGGRARTTSDRPGSLREFEQFPSDFLPSDVMRSKLNLVTGRLVALTGRWWDVRKSVEARMKELREITDQEARCRDMKKEAQSHLGSLLDDMARIENESVARIKDLNLDIIFSGQPTGKDRSSSGRSEELKTPFRYRAHRGVFILGPDEWLSKLDITQQRLVRELANNLLGVFGSVTAAVQAIASVRGRPESITMIDMDVALRNLKLGALSRPALLAVFGALDWEKEGSLTADALRRRLTVAASRSAVVCFAPPPPVEIYKSLSVVAGRESKQERKAREERGRKLEHARAVLGLSSSETSFNKTAPTQSTSVGKRKARRNSLPTFDMFRSFLLDEQHREHEKLLKSLSVDDSRIASTKKQLSSEAKRFREVIKQADPNELFDTGMFFNKHSLSRTTKYLTPGEKKRREEALEISQGLRRQKSIRENSKPAVETSVSGKQEMIVLRKQHADYIADPYTMLINYKRSFKFLRLLKENNAPVLVIGSKNQGGVSWKNHFEGLQFSKARMDMSVIATASANYHLIMCLDPILYIKALYQINVPVMMVATNRELNEHPEILDACDYLLPCPTARADFMLRDIVANQVLKEAKPDLSVPVMPEAKPSEVVGGPVHIPEATSSAVSSEWT